MLNGFYDKYFKVGESEEVRIQVHEKHLAAANLSAVILLVLTALISLLALISRGPDMVVLAMLNPFDFQEFTGNGFQHFCWNLLTWLWLLKFLVTAYGFQEVLVEALVQSWSLAKKIGGVCSAILQVLAFIPFMGLIAWLFAWLMTGMLMLNIPFMTVAFTIYISAVLWPVMWVGYQIRLKRKMREIRLGVC